MIGPRVKLFTYIAGVGITTLVAAVTVRIFFFPAFDIPLGTVSAYTALLGFPTVVYALLRWSRGNDNSGGGDANGGGD